MFSFRGEAIYTDVVFVPLQWQMQRKMMLWAANIHGIDRDKLVEVNLLQPLHLDGLRLKVTTSFGIRPAENQT